MGYHTPRPLGYAPFATPHWPRPLPLKYQNRRNIEGDSTRKIEALSMFTKRYHMTSHTLVIGSKTTSIYRLICVVLCWYRQVHFIFVVFCKFILAVISLYESRRVRVNLSCDLNLSLELKVQKDTVRQLVEIRP